MDRNSMPYVRQRHTALRGRLKGPNPRPLPCMPRPESRGKDECCEAASTSQCGEPDRRLLSGSPSLARNECARSARERSSWDEWREAPSTSRRGPGGRTEQGSTFRGLRQSLRALTLALLLLQGLAARAAEPLRFVVTFAPSVTERSFTGRVLVMLGDTGGGEPRFGPNWFSPKPFFAVDVKEAAPEKEIVVGDDAISFPAPISQLPAGDYAVQAVMDLKADSHDIGNDPGNAYSALVNVHLDPTQGGTVRLRVDQIVQPRSFPESARVKLV